jgi:small nuclear ribonucleoprotein (snRNP)-like protein
MLQITSFKLIKNHINFIKKLIVKLRTNNNMSGMLKIVVEQILLRM